MEDETITLDLNRLKFEKTTEKAHCFSNGKYGKKYSVHLILPISLAKNIHWKFTTRGKRLVSVDMPTWWWDKQDEDLKEWVTVN